MEGTHIARYFYSTPVKKQPLDSDFRAELVSTFEPDIKEFEQVCHRSLGSWLGAGDSG